MHADNYFVRQYLELPCPNPDFKGTARHSGQKVGHAMMLCDRQVSNFNFKLLNDLSVDYGLIAPSELIFMWRLTPTYG